VSCVSHILDYLVLNERETWTREDLARVIRSNLADRNYRYSENLRTAATEMPYTLTTAEWVEVCRELGINEGTAYYAIAHARKYWREMGEI
jgi:hypothetical protein